MHVPWLTPLFYTLMMAPEGSKHVAQLSHNKNIAPYCCVTAVQENIPLYCVDSFRKLVSVTVH